MINRENVIKGLADISEYVRAKADIAGIGKGKEVFDSYYRAAEDAIALIREQEPVEPHIEHDSDDDTWYYECGACHKAIDFKDRFCRHCGRRAKWDEVYR